ncbi:MAG: dihydrofolate reductase [Bacteroidales bacterium]|nr:dihydrofolate reductase [Bacteroidales bacterium]
MTPDTTINIIVAVADDWAIGREGDMPWHISADLKYFKAKTGGNSVIMGRRTWESIGCKPLPGRENIVVSARLAEEWKDAGTGAGAEGGLKDADAGQTSAIAVESLDKALDVASRPDIFIMGGGMIYRQAMDVADRLYVTHVHTTVPDADTYFPVIDPEVWGPAERSETFEDPRSGLKYEFTIYVRKFTDE